MPQLYYPSPPHQKNNSGCRDPNKIRNWMIWKNFHRTFFFFLNPAEALPPLCFEEEREREPESAVNRQIRRATGSDNRTWCRTLSVCPPGGRSPAASPGDMSVMVCCFSVACFTLMGSQCIYLFFFNFLFLFFRLFCRLMILS